MTNNGDKNIEELITQSHKIGSIWMEMAEIITTVIANNPNGVIHTHTYTKQKYARFLYGLNNSLK